MGFGGPVWHCSVASPIVALTDSRLLREMAYELLDGFGDAKTGEWTEDRPKAFHLRRRLNDQEQKRVGLAIDCRTTEEGQHRYDAIKPFLPPQALYLVREEVPGIQL
jgi:hypothetical protein